MKLNQVVVTILFLTSIGSEMTIDLYYTIDVQSIALGIMSFCYEFFTKELIDFDVVLYGKDDGLLRDITNLFMDATFRKYSSTVLHKLTADDFLNFPIKKSSVILIKSGSEFIKFFDNLAKLKAENKELTFLIYLDTPDIDNFACPPSYVYININIYILINTSMTDLLLQQIVLFSTGLCYNPHFRTLNIFYKFEFRWDKELESEQRFQNFYECPLNFLHSNNEFLYFKDENEQPMDLSSDSQTLFDEYVKRNKYHFGLIADVMQILEKIRNFKTFYFPDIMSENFYMKKFQMDFIFGDVLGRDNTSRLTNHLIESSGIFIINKYNYNLTRMFVSHFDTLTWISILMSLSVALVVIFYMHLRLGIVRIHPRKDLSRPLLQVLQITFGMMQKKLPQANFGRFLITLLMTLCVILRIFYWSQLTRFMITDMETVELKNVEDLVDGNYTIYLCLSSDIRRKLNL
jgi:hypothetical protein